MAYAVEIKAIVQQDYDTGRDTKTDSVFKAYIPNFLYKPPYGYPLNKNVSMIKKLAHNGYIFSIKTAIKDRIASTDFDIVLKEEYQTDNKGELVDFSQYEQKKKEILSWFDRPNQNKESFEQLLRKIVDSILEVDAGVWVKVFSRGGEFRELFCHDGGTFLKNPDIHGYIGNRADFVWPVESYFDQESLQTTTSEDWQKNEQVRQLYDAVYRTNAAYFQYGWTASAMPVPFGKREVVYMMRHPRSDSIYGTGPIEVLTDVLLTLVYGSNYNLDFYVNNNMPDGIIQLLDANETQIRAFRARFEAEFKYKDTYNNYRRKFHSYPITSKEAKFTQFQLSAEQMQIIEQQKWFTKIVWACFGITPSELGFTEDSNKATEVVQSNVGKKKLITPLLKLIQYHINSEIMPEFEAPMFEFRFNNYDIEEDLKKHNLYQMQINMGIKTPEMIAEESGIDVAKLKKQKEESFKQQQAWFETTNNNSEQESKDDLKKSDDDASKEEKELKSFFVHSTKKKDEKLDSALKTYFGQVEKQIMNAVESLGRNELNKVNLNYQVKGLPEDVLSLVAKAFAVDQFAPLVNKEIKSSFLDGLEQAGKELDRNFLPNQKAIDFLSQQSFENIKDVSEETANRLRKEISQGIVNRESVQEIKNRVRNGKVVGLNEKFTYQGQTFDTAPAHVNCRSRIIFVQEGDE